VVKDNHYPSHYDPFKNPKYVAPDNTTPQVGKPILSLEFYPKHCIRTVTAFRRCLIANDDSKDKCHDEGNDILAICPSFALDQMRDNTRLKLKLEAIANQKYKRATEVSDYNQGRTVADIP
jgi:hypothetical protein